MAEESTDSLVTREKNELDGEIFAGNSDSLSNGRDNHASQLRASIGSYYAGDSSLRNSAEKSNSAKSRKNVVPNYLRASTGSCHDFCKYGIEHSFEKKERNPLQRRIAKPLPNELYPVQIQVTCGKEKKLADCTPPTDSKYHSPDLKPSPDTKSYSSKPKTSSEKDNAIKHKPSKDAKNHSPETPSSTKSYARKPKMPSNAKNYSPKENAASSGDKNLMPKSKPKNLMPKSKPVSTKRFSSADPPEIVKSVIFPSTEVENLVKPGSSMDNKMSRVVGKATYVSQQHSSPVKPKPVKVKPSPSSDDSDGMHGKGRTIKPVSSTDNKMPRPVRKTSYVSQQHSFPGKSKPVKVKSSSSSDNSDDIRGKGRRNSNAKPGKILTALRAPAKKVLGAPAANLLPKLSVNKTVRISSGKAANLHLVSPRLRRFKTKESKDGKVPEKTLHVIETETEINVPETNPSDDAITLLPSSSSPKLLSSAKSSSSSSSSSHEEDDAESEHSGVEEEEVEVISDNSVSQEIGEVQPVKENHNKTQRKSRVVVSEDKCRSPVKLKFKSGRVVDLQSDNNGPRRLKFRRARVLGAEDSRGDLRRRPLKKAEVKDGATRAEVSSEQVVLKHQDVQEKDAQVLLNNVIEETASKLVESRKSKVKALVGAFETVISLQDGKPSLQVVS